MSSVNQHQLKLLKELNECCIKKFTVQARINGLLEECEKEKIHPNIINLILRSDTFHDAEEILYNHEVKFI